MVVYTLFLSVYINLLLIIKLVLKVKETIPFGIVYCTFSNEYFRKKAFEI